MHQITYLREHIPLKQGLRHKPPWFFCDVFFSQRAYSIKTRIKTNSPMYIANFPLLSQRAYSIKTRIKTIKYPIYRRIGKTQRAYSIKTRIKTVRFRLHQEIA